MKATLKITPVRNVDEATNTLLDCSLIKEVQYDWEDMVIVREVGAKEADTLPLKQISVFRHRLIIDNEQYYILYMLSQVGKG